MSEVLILLPAAGASERMRGRDKLLEPVAGEALLRRQVRVALASGAPVLVTLPRRAAGPRAEVLEGLGLGTGCRVAYVAAREGMAVSLRTAAQAARASGAAGLMVMLPDMPEIGTADIETLRAAFAAAPDRCLRAVTPDGRPGHPVVFPARLYDALEGVTGDAGGRDILAGEEVRTVPLADDRAITDLDTPEAWAAWRARTGL